MPSVLAFFCTEKVQHSGGPLTLLHEKRMLMSVGLQYLPAWLTSSMLNTCIHTVKSIADHTHALNLENCDDDDIHHNNKKGANKQCHNAAPQVWVAVALQQLMRY